MQRLDKILSDAGAGTRSQLRAVIRAGRVVVNGEVVTAPEAKFDEKSAEIILDGQAVTAKSARVFMLHKPQGYVTSTDEKGQHTVMELLPPELRKLGLLPVGRLDKDTEGLLLFTNDGQLAHKLISPKKEVWKTYYAEHAGTATEADVRAFSEGVTLSDGTKCLPARLEGQGAGKSLVSVCEGKYHQVRRMMASRGLHVTYLRRLSIGDLTMGELPPGKLRELTVEEVCEKTKLL